MRPPGPWEIGLILIIILIVFGVGKLPQVGDAIGKGLKSFRKAQTEEPNKPIASSTGAEANTSPEVELAKARLEAAQAKAKAEALEAKARTVEQTGNKA